MLARQKRRQFVLQAADGGLVGWDLRRADVAAQDASQAQGVLDEPKVSGEQFACSAHLGKGCLGCRRIAVGPGMGDVADELGDDVGVARDGAAGS